MQISFDGGALCSQYRFGTTIFSQNLLQGLALHDKENTYYVYTLNKNCLVPKARHIKKQLLLPKKGWMKLRVSAQEFVHPKDIFLATNQAIPLFTQSRIITFSHGLSFLKLHYLYQQDLIRLKNQLDEYIKRSDFIVVSSKRVEQELLEYNPKSRKKVVVVPFGIPYDMMEYKKEKRDPSLLFVGNNQPVKNVQVLVQICAELGLPLTLVGPFTEYKSEQVTVHEEISRTQLRNLYRTSGAYVSVSHYESFNLPILEALSQECPVIALKSAVIPELEPFVHTAKQVEQIKQQLTNFKKGKTFNADFKLLRNTFTWETYIEKLLLLYNEL